MSARARGWIIAAVILLIALFLATQVWTVHLGLHRYRSGDIEGARPLLKVARLLNPFSEPVLLALADIDLREGKAAEAEEIVRSVIKRKSKSVRARNLLGVALQAQGRFDEAMKEYEAAINMVPNFPLAHFNRGYLLMRMGKKEEGMAELDKAVELDPKLAENKKEALRRLNLAPEPEPFSHTGKD